MFECDNGPEFKSDMTKLLEKHKVEVGKATTKSKKTHTVFVEAFNKESNGCSRVSRPLKHISKLGEKSE